MSIQTTTRLLTAGVLLFASAACGDLTVEPRSTVTSDNVFEDPASYRLFLAKLYAGLVVSGQTGPHGDPDILGIDEGFSQYIRGYWQLQELPTDHAIIGWGDIGLPELNTQLWSSSNPFITAMYARIYYQVMLVNEFLRQTTDDKLTGRGVTAQLRTEIEQYRAEARFLRALSYWHAVDLFGNVPLITEEFDLEAAARGELPTQATRTEVFNFVETELEAIRDQLPTRANVQYGRASRSAVDMVLAKLFLNSQVYTGTARWSDARAAAEAVIAAGYTLDPNFRHMFTADNHESPELIFAVPQDGERTRTWGGLTYIVHASVGGNMNAAAFGIDGGWWGLRLRPETVDRYEGGVDGPDRRTSFFHDSGQTKTIGSIGNFNHGIAAPKFTNVTFEGQPGSHATFPDTDFPMFRLADAYLIYAEAVLRGGGGDPVIALNRVNELRRRAYGGTAGDITSAQLTLDFILDERSRELLWEAHRRQDLVRFGRFTTAGIWAWKGGVQAGRLTEAFRNLYPIPASELVANPNIQQNSGY
jgi:hypothetical protein